MCGIVGYLGSSAASPILLSELRCLEYRGYDSAGVAVLENGQLFVLKAAGKLSNLQNLLEEKQPSATVGIGHTRWATHGVPNDQNAHPHLDSSGTIAVVHNGIIENYQTLREELAAAGCRFVSDTDTEVAAHLVSEGYKACGGDMVAAVQQAVARMKGAYALGIINQKHPDTIYAVNHNYSLAVGLGEGESYLASDSVAVRQYTNRILRLGQSEIAVISAGGARLYSFDGKEVTRPPVIQETSKFVLDKEGYRHFLLKEINEQPLVMRQTLSKYMSRPDQPVDFSRAGSGNNGDAARLGVSLSDDEIKRIDRVFIVACGTAYHAGLVGKHIIEQLCEIPVDVEVASEMRGRKMLVDRNTLTVAVSQSGETADTLAALSAAAEKGSLTVGITNRPDSHLTHLTGNVIVTECGVEVSVAATKTFVAQVACFYMLAFHLAERRASVGKERLAELKRQLLAIPTLQEQVIGRCAEIRNAVLPYAEAYDMVFIGRGINYPIALEGSLKLKELSYIHSSGYAAGELKHGPIAVLDSRVPVVTVLVPGAVYEKTLSNAQEARARKAQMIAVAVDGDTEAETTFDTILRIPPVDEFLSPLLTVIPLQLMSYYIADFLGKDVDQPRNLAKSVTVE